MIWVNSLSIENHTLFSLFTSHVDTFKGVNYHNVIKEFHLRSTNHKNMNASKLKLKEENMQKAEVSINFQRLDDSQLVAYFSKPEHMEAAFREVIRRYQEKIYNHVRSMILSHDDTDFIVCAVFQKLWEGLSQFRTDNLRTSMYRFASNETIAFLKNKHANIDFDEAQPEFSEALVDAQFVDKNSDALKMLKAMCYLTYKQKLVFNLKYFDELSYAEISDLTQISEVAVKTTFQHATKKLEIYLGVLN